MWECKLVKPLWRIVWRLLKKLKIELLHYLAIPLLGINLEKKVNMTIVIRTIRRGEYWVTDGNLGYIPTDGVEKPVKDQEE